LLTRRRRSGRGQLLERELRDTMLIATPRRTVWLYQPPVQEPCPLLIVLDGKDYLRRTNLPAIVENLAAPGKIRPLALAFVDSGGPARGVEYLCSEATLGLLLTQVLPMAQAELNLLPPESGTYGILGASLGGLMALYAGLRAPQVFTHILSQSGAFLLPGYETPVFELVRRQAAPALKVWLDVGRYESLLQANRTLLAEMKERGYDIGYREFNAGHNYPAWRDNLHHGLMALYPGTPLSIR
jgi:enterochelin esterase family protein